MLQLAPFHHRTEARKSDANPVLTRERKLKRALRLPLSVLERGPGGEVSRKGRVRYNSPSPLFWREGAGG